MRSWFWVKTPGVGGVHVKAKVRGEEGSFQVWHSQRFCVVACHRQEEETVLKGGRSLSVGGLRGWIESGTKK